MKIVTVVGARPQFIKAAVVSRAIDSLNKESGKLLLEEIIVHTGQHYDANMSEIFFKEMRIPEPDCNLGIAAGTHGAMTGRMIEGIEKILVREKPDAVLVYGDTNSTLAGALAAAKLNIPVAHVEAGLRSFNMQMPEEVNRVLTDRVSKWLFCPTKNAEENLNKEGLAYWQKAEAFNVGDVMFDAVLFYREIAAPTSQVANLVEKLGNLYYLATLHRAENTDDPVRFKNILSALDSISRHTRVVLPLHPRTRKQLKNSGITLTNIKFIEPVGYFDMITLLGNCKGVFTDSGGLQKEAFFFEKPCITLRDETEWVELVEQGVNILVGANYEMIISLENTFMNRLRTYKRDLYGDGHAGQKIVDIIWKSFYKRV